VPPHYDYRNAVPTKPHPVPSDAADIAIEKLIKSAQANKLTPEALDQLNILNKLAADHSDAATVAKKINFLPRSPISASVVVEGILINKELGFTPNLEQRAVLFDELRCQAERIEIDCYARAGKAIPAEEEE
jgi:hypothetical protein